MTPFLKLVAQDILAKHGTELSRIAVVFPNKRASLFLSEYLAQEAGKPIWSPAYLTISELFRQHATKQVADPLKLVCDLYTCFTQQTGIDETLDHFFGWGQLLLSDFDDIDKNMADADKVLANLRDIHELDDVSYLTEEQRDIIQRFFSNFNKEQNSELKKRFLQLWSKMADIYHAFNEKLAEQNLAYEGALSREVVEQGDLQANYDLYIFVGFNMVQQVEQRLFSILKQQGRSRFYWDYDHYYMKGNNEAGHYIGNYLAHFPNELESTNDEAFNCFAKPKSLSIVSATTENIQARYISNWLKEGNRIADGRHTAIILCNEALLPTVIHCLPSKVEKINITTGFPLLQSPVSSLVNVLYTLQTLGYQSNRNAFKLSQVNMVLKHPYIGYLSEGLAELHQQLNEKRIYYPTPQQLCINEGATLLFTPLGEKAAFNNSQLLTWLCEIVQRIARQSTSRDPLFQESIFRTYTLLNRLLMLVNSQDLRVDTVTMGRLIKQLISSTSVPFHGEPAMGLQVMGVLETRNLDFDHVLILSCNEGNMPKGVNDASFIPYSLRKAYGLTTIDHKVSIYSYYFHRLISRAKDITIAYNNATSNGQTGEMSRFMLQLMVQGGHPIEFKTLQAGQAFTPSHPTEVEKTEAVMRPLYQRFSLNENNNQAKGALLTPTAINRYMRCPLQFYYHYACGLLEPDNTEEDLVDNRMFGNIFHEASRFIYRRLMGRQQVISAEAIKETLKSDVEIKNAVDMAFKQELFHVKADDISFKMQLNGLQLINREVIAHYLQRLLRIDEQNAPFSIIGLESDVKKAIHTPHINTTIGGRIDRIDKIGNTVRVIDYKTGSKRIKALSNTAAIFSAEGAKNHGDYYLQTMLYSSIVRETPQISESQAKVSPALIFIQHANSNDYDPVLCFGKERINDIAQYELEFKTLLTEKINEIFNPAIAFVPTNDDTTCSLCAYKLLCRKNK